MTKPALQVEGLPVEVKTTAFDVQITVSGPIVPGEGLPDQPAATTCTWTVTMKDATPTFQSRSPTSTPWTTSERCS